MVGLPYAACMLGYYITHPTHARLTCSDLMCSPDLRIISNSHRYLDHAFVRHLVLPLLGLPCPVLAVHEEVLLYREQADESSPYRWLSVSSHMRAHRGLGEKGRQKHLYRGDKGRRWRKRGRRERGDYGSTDHNSGEDFDVDADGVEGVLSFLSSSSRRVSHARGTRGPLLHSHSQRFVDADSIGITLICASPIAELLSPPAAPPLPSLSPSPAPEPTCPSSASSLASIPRVYSLSMIDPRLGDVSDHSSPSPPPSSSISPEVSPSTSTRSTSVSSASCKTSIFKNADAEGEGGGEKEGEREGEEGEGQGERQREGVDEKKEWIQIRNLSKEKEKKLKKMTKNSDGSGNGGDIERDGAMPSPSLPQKNIHTNAYTYTHAMHSEYAQGQAPSLPVVLYFHGGGWISEYRASDTQIFLSQWAQEASVPFIYINYSLGKPLCTDSLS